MAEIEVRLILGEEMEGERACIHKTQIHTLKYSNKQCLYIFVFHYFCVLIVYHCNFF